jgi:hypothetical protein
MLYNQRKKAVGSVNQHTVAKGQIDPQQKHDSTAAAVAAETGVSPATVKRAREGQGFCLWKKFHKQKVAPRARGSGSTFFRLLVSG